MLAPLISFRPPHLIPRMESGRRRPRPRSTPLRRLSDLRVGRLNCSLAGCACARMSGRASERGSAITKLVRRLLASPGSDGYGECIWAGEIRGRRGDRLQLAHIALLLVQSTRARRRRQLRLRLQLQIALWVTPSGALRWETHLVSREGRSLLAPLRLRSDLGDSDTSGAIREGRRSSR